MANLRIIDAKDREILAALQRNGRTSNAEIARRVEMAPSAVYERIRKLEEQGVIMGYEARLDPRALGLDTLAFVLVRVEERLDEPRAGEQLKDVPGVQEVHHIAGEDCYLLKVRTESTEALGRLLRERIGAIGSVRSTRTTIVLGSVKEAASLPIDEPADQSETGQLAAAQGSDRPDEDRPETASGRGRASPRRAVLGNGARRARRTGRVRP